MLYTRALIENRAVATLFYHKFFWKKSARVIYADMHIYIRFTITAKRRKKLIYLINLYSQRGEQNSTMYGIFSTVEWKLFYGGLLLVHEEKECTYCLFLF